jgi:purine-binding chemotaxis protein CheW
MSLSRPRRRARLEQAADVEGVAHLVFIVGGEEYAVPLLSVERIVGLGGLIALPDMPGLRGVLSLPGERLVIVDMAAALGAPHRPNAPENCALVIPGPVEGPKAVGLAIDAVSRLIGLTPEQLASPPRLGSLLDAPFVAAMAPVGSSFVPVLDLDRLLASPQVLSGVRESGTAVDARAVAAAADGPREAVRS